MILIKPYVKALIDNNVIVHYMRNLKLVKSNNVPDNF